MQIYKGFSLIEILVALFVVSLTAVNITGLQKLVADEQRDNLSRSLILSMATEKMEGVLSMEEVDDLDAINEGELPEVVQIGHTTAEISWAVSDVSAIYNANGDFREVTMDISWLDAKEDKKTFSYSELVNLDLLLAGASSDEIVDPLADIVVSTLNTNDVIYFEPKMGYKNGSFVIHDSYLYQATQVHDVGNGSIRELDAPAAPKDENGNDIIGENNGWYSYGPIDNEELANNEDLATLFLE